MIKPEKFSVGVSGKGRLILHFVQILKTKFPTVIIYDRNKERDSPPSTAPIPRHPQVSDLDAVFSLSGAMETVTIRCGREHRFFNYPADPEQIDPVAQHLLLNRMVGSVRELLYDES